MSDSDITVPAAEANRSFSKLLRIARDGGRVTITAYGHPIAELVPAGGVERAESEDRRRREALLELEEHWAGLRPVIVGTWTRDELYAHE